MRIHRLISLILFLAATSGQAEENISALAERGKALYFERVSCWVCHGDSAEGGVGPTLQNGPTPMDILEQLGSNPQMGIIVAELNPDADDLVALATYLSTLSAETATNDKIVEWRAALASIEAAKGPDAVIYVSARDRKVMEIMDFQTVLDDWKRRAKTGSIRRDYDVKVLATYEPAEQVFFPEPGELYFYENVGTNARRAPPGTALAASTQVVVGNARTREIITSREMPEELRGAVHMTVLSPDGRYLYIIGPSSEAAPAGMGRRGGNVLRTSATLLKVDALTLQPIKQLAVGGRTHHAQVFRDKYLLIDTFVSDPDGLDLFLLDPETDQIIGGIKSEDLGGSNYTAWTDDRFIYVLMQPGADGGAIGGATQVATGQMTALLPYWVAKIDPDTWEVVGEFPYSGYRGDWIVIDSKGENLYVPAAGSSNVTKLSANTGAIAWSAATGTGPYGGTLTADEKEIWISNKGEATGAIGRTVTIVEAATGRPLETVFSGYMSDHVLLSPSGKEMWVTSNGEGRIYVFDVATREQLDVIDMPGRGDPHGLVWVKYDDNRKARVVRDQGGFHNGVNPALGKPLLD